MGYIFCMILSRATAHLLNWKQVVSEANTMKTNNMILYDMWLETVEDKKFDTILTALDLSGNEMEERTINNENVKMDWKMNSQQYWIWRSKNDKWSIEN